MCCGKLMVPALSLLTSVLGVRHGSVKHSHLHQLYSGLLCIRTRVFLMLALSIGFLQVLSAALRQNDSCAHSSKAAATVCSACPQGAHQVAVMFSWITPHLHSQPRSGATACVNCDTGTVTLQPGMFSIWPSTPHAAKAKAIACPVRRDSISQTTAHNQPLFAFHVKPEEALIGCVSRLAERLNIDTCLVWRWWLSKMHPGLLCRPRGFAWL